MSFTNVFGGSTLQPADVAYRAVVLSANATLVWPQFSTSSTDYAARTMDVTPSGAGLALTLPPANQVSTGYDLLISNRGASAFTVKGNAGATLAVVNPGEAKYLQVTVNTSLEGSWNVVAFGAVTSAADAASLAGYGIAASGATLVASQPVSTFSSDYTIIAADRARAYVWTGGSGTLSLTAFGTLGSDFWFEVRNQGSGTLTVDPAGAELIDGASTIILQPTESAIVHSGAAAWYTVGRGRSVQFSFTLLVKGITGGTVTLTSTEAANVVQRYTGVLVSNANIVLPSVVQVYYVSNQTTGAFSVTFKTSGVGTTVSIPTGQNAVLFCDGLNVINTSTTISGLTALTLGAGSVSVPSLNYSGDTSTGLYSPTSAQVAVAISGTQRFLVTAAGATIVGTATVAGTDILVAGANNATLGFGLAGAGASAFVSVIGAAGSIINGSSVGDMGFRVNAKQFLFSVDAGATIPFRIGSTGVTTFNYASLAAGFSQYQVAASPRGYIGVDGGGILGTGPGTGFGIRSEADLLLLSAAGVFSVVLNSSGNFGVGGPALASVSATKTGFAPSFMTNWEANNTDSGDVDRGSYQFRAKNFAGSGFAWGVFGYTNSLNTTFNAGLRFLTNSSGSSLTALQLTHDGRVYGAALHNNAGPVTGTTNQYIASGTYTPTGFTGTNCPSITPGLFRWMRVGNVVTVSGSCTVGITTGGVTTAAGISLPIASAFTTGLELDGSIQSSTTAALGNTLLSADATNDRAYLQFNTPSSGTIGVAFHFTYIVL